MSMKQTQLCLQKKIERDSFQMSALLTIGNVLKFSVGQYGKFLRNFREITKDIVISCGPQIIKEKRNIDYEKNN